MAVAAITYADVKEYIRDWRNGTSSAEDVRKQLRIIEDAMDDVMNTYAWPWARTTRQITTVGGRRFTLSVDLDNGDTTATATGTPFSVNELAGRWLVPESGTGNQFQVLSNTTSVITFVQQYSGDTIASGETCVVYAPSYLLPDYFGTLETFNVMGNGLRPAKFSQEEMEMARSRPSNAGLATGWYVGTLNSDGIAGMAQPSLWLFPNPLGPAAAEADDDNTPQIFQITFRRKWGWFDATTKAWKMVPTADTDILDFPETQRGLLRAVIRYAVVMEYGGDLLKADQNLGRKVGAAVTRVEEDSTPFQAAHMDVRGGTNDWSKTVNWLGTIVVYEDA